jgi:3-oxoacyl-[acyl-carrier-protein] synthase II
MAEWCGSVENECTRELTVVLFPLPQRSSTPPRVVVTGAGVITALGVGWESNAEGFRLGRTAFRPVTLFDVSRQRVRNAAEVDLPASLPPTHLTGREERRLTRAGRMLLLAGEQALRQAGWGPSENLPIVLGTTSGGMSMGEAYYRQAISQPEVRQGQLTRVVQYQSQRQALELMQAFRINGPISIIANACASGANAVGHAWSLLRRGHAERAFTGGYDALSQLVFAGFDSLQALSSTTCRPFDAQRDGLALGEGAAVLALETLDSARLRGADILGEIAGYGAVTDSHHLTQPHPEGDAALASMKKACQEADVSPSQIGYVNAHGTGTPLNDSAEAAAINRWAGESAPTLPVSSTKASIGHLLGAAGAVEALVCLMVLREQWLPPMTAVQTPDPSCRFRLVREPAAANFDYALSNSFGFGGANATLILRRWA